MLILKEVIENITHFIENGKRVSTLELRAWKVALESLPSVSPGVLDVVREMEESAAKPAWLMSEITAQAKLVEWISQLKISATPEPVSDVWVKCSPDGVPYAAYVPGSPEHHKAAKGDSFGLAHLVKLHGAPAKGEDYDCPLWCCEENPCSGCDTALDEESSLDKTEDRCAVCGYIGETEPLMGKRVCADAVACQDRKVRQFTQAASTLDLPRCPECGGTPWIHHDESIGCACHSEPTKPDWFRYVAEDTPCRECKRLPLRVASSLTCATRCTDTPGGNVQTFTPSEWYYQNK